MAFEESLARVVSRHEELAALLSEQPPPSGEKFAQLSKEYSDLAPVVESITRLDKLKADLEGARQMAAEAGDDPEMRAMAREEISTLEAQLPDLEHKLKLALLPKDSADQKNAILEVRAGTGGDEAALFAADLFHMYQRYAEAQRWKFEVLDATETEIGGFKEAFAMIRGGGVFARLKFESGVHRVQRVPVTESGGRIHTSAATVAVLPEAEEVDVHVDPTELRVDTYRSQGAGGQHVNTTDSAVRITHVPTGIVVQCQDEKSQHKNRAKAMKMLLARLYDQQRQDAMSERAADRKAQVGSGDRSERIRTYNFPQGRVTDHRINLTLHKLDRVLEGDLDEMVDALISEDQAAKLAEIE